MSAHKFRPYLEYLKYSKTEMINKSHAFYSDLKRRRSIRQFAKEDIPLQVIKNCIQAAGTAPSGAHKQPWYFVVVNDPAVKKEIRKAAEKEEQQFYQERASKEWLDDLKPLGTDASKPFLEHAPCLIAIFEEKYKSGQNNKKIKNYYTKESVGIATGILIAALHQAGLVSLTHTPSPMGFLNEILKRPANEKPFLILITGYPAKEAVVPDLERKNIAEFVSFI